MRNLSLAALLSIVALAGCAPPPAAQNSPELAARADAWAERYNDGDLEGVADLYAEDARLLPPNAEMVQGRAAIKKDFQAMMDAGLTGALETVEAMVAGDLGYRVGTYTLTKPDGSIADKGKYIESWRRIDGEWKITNDAYNSDLAAAGSSGTLVMGSHQVKDPAVWLAAWQADDKRRQQFAEHGAPSVRVFQNPEKPDTVGLLIDVTDMAAFQAFLASDEGVAAKAEDGVKDETLRLLVAVE